MHIYTCFLVFAAAFLSVAAAVVLLTLPLTDAATHAPGMRMWTRLDDKLLCYW